MKELAQRILDFIAKYAKLTPESMGSLSEYSSPDAYQLVHCAEAFSNGVIPRQCFSEWGSGGYAPYTSKEGQAEHDAIVKEIYAMINAPKNH